MTDRERLRILREAIASLEKTQQGHVQWVAAGKPKTYWQSAMTRLGKLEADLEPPKVPALGPIWKGGKSILLHDLTHLTAGIPLYPAFDDAYVQGREITAPEALTIIAPYTSARPGMAFYAKGKSLLRYWFGHLDRNHPLGKQFVKGQLIGRVAPNSIGGGPHAHCGINVELLLGSGKQLAHHTDYTHGAPTVGAQLAALL